MTAPPGFQPILLTSPHPSDILKIIGASNRGLELFPVLGSTTMLPTDGFKSDLL